MKVGRRERREGREERQKEVRKKYTKELIKEGGRKKRRTQSLH